MNLGMFNIIEFNGNLPAEAQVIKKGSYGVEGNYSVVGSRLHSVGGSSRLYSKVEWYEG